MNDAATTLLSPAEPAEQDVRRPRTAKKTIKATVFHGVKDLRVEEVPRPVPGPGEAVIRVTLTTICGTDPDEQAANETLSRWMEEHGGKIYGLGLRLCGSPQEAEDLVQETFLQALRGWESFEGRSSPSSWLFTIASRICQRRHRRRSGEPARMEPLERLLPSGETDVPDVPDAGEGPFDERLRREAQEAVEAALPRIPLGFRLPLVLKDIAELSIPEIAQVLGLREATVKTRIHRARLALRRELVKQLPRRPAPPPDHDRRVCLDLLQAKQEALDRGVPLPVAPAELCARCRSLFTTLDLTAEACHAIGRGELPPAVRDLLRRRLAAASA